MGRGNRGTTLGRLPVAASLRLTPAQAVLHSVLSPSPTGNGAGYVLARGWVHQFAISQRMHPVVRADIIGAPRHPALGHELGSYGRTHAGLLAQLEAFSEDDHSELDRLLQDVPALMVTLTGDPQATAQARRELLEYLKASSGEDFSELEGRLRDVSALLNTSPGNTRNAVEALRDLLGYLKVSRQRAAERRQQVADRVSSLVLLDQYLLETSPAVLARRRLADLRVRRGKDGPEARFGPLFTESARFNSWWIPQPWTSQARLAREYAAGYDMHGSLIYIGTNRRFWFGDCSLLAPGDPRASTLFPQLVVVNP